MHDRLVMVKYHDDGRNHKKTLLDCDLFPMLNCFLASEKYIPANEQLLFSDAVFFLTGTQTSIDPAVESAGVSSPRWFVSFRSHETKVTELAIFNEEVCVCLHQSIFNNNHHLYMNLVRDIFEDERIIKAGKDLWLFMLLLLRNYVMKIQNCYSIHDVE